MRNQRLAAIIIVKITANASTRPASPDFQVLILHATLFEHQRPSLLRTAMSAMGRERSEAPRPKVDLQRGAQGFDGDGRRESRFKVDTYCRYIPVHAGDGTSIRVKERPLASVTRLIR